MTDITLCTNHKTNGCKLSASCKRAQKKKIGEKGKKFSPWRDGQECEGYMHIETDQERRDGISQARVDYYRDNHT